MQKHAAPARPTQLCLLLTLACCCWIIAAEPLCKQQGLLMLDEPHPPYRVRLPFCDKYRCSCCNASHALAIQHSVQHLLADDELGLSCKAGLVMLACRLCDPQVGVGNVTTVCQSTCDRVYEACSEDYFAFDESTGLITPCTSQLSSSLVCSQLQQVVPSGADFCRAAGYTPSQSSSSSGSSIDAVACFDGSPVAADACSSAAPPQKQRGSSKTSSSSSSSSKRRSKRSSSSSSSSSSSGIWPFNKLKRRHKRMVAEVAQLVAGALTSTLVAAGIVLLLQRVMQPATAARRAAGRGRQGAPLQAAASRDRLAQAAEARAAGTGSRAAAAPAASVAQQQQQQQQQQHKKK